MITVLDAETAVEGGVLIWRLLLQVDDARIVYKFPAYTFEARVAEYGITNPDELLTTVLLEWLDDGDVQVNPYTVDEETARDQKRAATARLATTHQIAFAVDPNRGDIGVYLRQQVRLDKQNVAALRAQVEMSRRIHAVRTQVAIVDGYADEAGALAAYKRSVEKRNRHAESL